MHQELGLSRIPNCSYPYLVDDVAGWTALLICHITQPEVARCSFSEHGPFQIVVTIMLGEMLDVARYGQYGGKLHFYVKVGPFTHLEQSEISLLTVNKMGIVRLTVQHDLIASISFM